MRTIERTTQFKRDFKRERKGRHGLNLEGALTGVVGHLVADDQLASRYRDHSLAGEWIGFRDCPIRPDLVPIYEKPDPGALRLARLGSHSALGL